MNTVETSLGRQAMTVSQQLNHAVKGGRRASITLKRASDAPADELTLLIDGVMQSSRDLAAAVEGARAESFPLDASVKEAVVDMLKAAVRAAEIASVHTSAVNPGSALEASIAVARKVGVDASLAIDALAQAFFRRLTPSYTHRGGAKTALTQSNDVLDLPELTQDTLLRTLRLRFEREVVYTRIG